MWANGTRRTDIVAGIAELAEATGLIRHLPTDTSSTLAALFYYRNRMFHHGFEWPEEERAKFEARLAAESWPDDWFESARSGGKPWVFYMSETFIKHCLDTIDAAVTAFGTLIKEDL